MLGIVGAMSTWVLDIHGYALTSDFEVFLLNHHIKNAAICCLCAVPLLLSKWLNCKSIWLAHSCLGFTAVVTEKKVSLCLCQFIRCLEISYNYHHWSYIIITAENVCQLGWSSFLIVSGGVLTFHEACSLLLHIGASNYLFFSMPTCAWSHHAFNTNWLTSPRGLQQVTIAYHSICMHGHSSSLYGSPSSHIIKFWCCALYIML